MLGILFTFWVMSLLIYEQEGSFFLPRGTGIKFRVGMFPLRRTVLSRDDSNPYENPYSVRTVSIMENIPHFGFPGFGLSGVYGVYGVPMAADK